ncbi:ABC transporter ATP-binding protein [Frigidibacter mobilis]|uniref:ABC transporter-related n=1 Tax=Frigidibacter mobilis TaxID=1335048 RepID=A0A159YZC6_9RHOB|nr:ABC transporter ATP-binding protein [Frigidibacter mobilis]AMY67922.1 ABC transporter-related [Frigidibacter mobilis]
MTGTGGALVTLSGVSWHFDGSPAPVLQGVDLTVAAGEVVVVLGPSGCGKTTLLRIIAGLLHPEPGTVRVAGRAPVPGQDSAIVFQGYRLLPWKTVAQNIGFALHALPAPQREARVARYLELVGLAKFAGAYPAALSGGMRQRVALARALACQPRLLLMDEPFAALDAQSRELMQMETMRLIAGAEGPAPGIVFVTHSVDEALMLADRIVLMSPRPGRIDQVLPVPFPRPRWQADPRHGPDFARLRQHLWDRLRAMVLSDPQSDFYGRG